MNWSTLPFALLKIAKWIRPLHVMARAIHGAASWGSVTIIRFRIGEVDRIMTRTGTFLQRIQSISGFSRKRKVIHTGSTSALWSSKCALYLVSSTMYAHPLLRPGSASLLETFLRLSRKLASRARKSACKYLFLHSSFCLSNDHWKMLTVDSRALLPILEACSFLAEGKQGIVPHNRLSSFDRHRQGRVLSQNVSSFLNVAIHAPFE